MNDRPDIIRSEEGGHMYWKMQTDPTFDAKKSTCFGKGHRLVEPIYRRGILKGYRFVPFGHYEPSDLHAIKHYASADDMIRNVYPVHFHELKTLKSLFVFMRQYDINQYMSPKEREDKKSHLP